MWYLTAETYFSTIVAEIIIVNNIFYTFTSVKEKVQYVIFGTCHRKRLSVIFADKMYFLTAVTKIVVMDWFSTLLFIEKGQMSPEKFKCLFGQVKCISDSCS